MRSARSRPVRGWTEVLVVAAAAAHAYDPVLNRWRSIAGHAPGQSQSAAAWTGRELLLLGSQADVVSYDPILGRSSRYASAPLKPRSALTAIWTDRELIVWDGEAGAAFTPSSQDAAGGGQS
jgi:hypothetical protein